MSLSTTGNPSRELLQTLLLDAVRLVLNKKPFLDKADILISNGFEVEAGSAIAPPTIPGFIIVGMINWS
jgi:hypothetical protein